MIEDIVCSKLLPPGTEMWASRYHGRTFYFCSLECRERFELEPEDYLAAPRLRKAAPAGHPRDAVAPRRPPDDHTGARRPVGAGFPSSDSASGADAC